MKVSQSSGYDCLLFAFLFVFVGSAECYNLENFGGPWRAIAADLQTFEKTNETFDDARWMLSIIWAAPSAGIQQGMLICVVALG
jgi:hypothetical protein